MTWLFGSSIHVISQCSYVFAFVSLGYPFDAGKKNSSSATSC